MLGSSWAAAQLADSQEGPSYMKLVSKFIEALRCTLLLLVGWD
jgi:hypothetical protein